MTPHPCSWNEVDQSYSDFSCFCPGPLAALFPVSLRKVAFVCMPTRGEVSLRMFLLLLSVSSDAMGMIISPLIGLTEKTGKLYLLMKD